MGVPRRGNEAEGSGDLVLRFERSERWLHWALAVPYLICLASAAVLIAFYNFSPSRPHRDVVAVIHRVGGVALIVLPLVALLRNRSGARLHLQNVRQAWGWTFADLKWLGLLFASALSRRVELPEQGKFNAGEKLNFMAVMTTYPIFIATGVLIWLPGVALLSWVVHVAFALAVAPLVAGHTYMALINPGTRKGLSGMITGYVDRRWAREHYRQWYRERSLTEGPSEGPRPDREGEPKPAATPPHSGAAPHRFGAPPGLPRAAPETAGGD